LLTYQLKEELLQQARPFTKKETSSLLYTRRFAPFFWTQFFGAFNDNIFKNALIILIAYSMIPEIKKNTDLLTNIAQAIFILPYFFISAFAGQLADKYEKAKLIRYTKVAELIIMSTAALAFYFNNIYVLIGLLFCIGNQATIFGPVKYSILPQQLKPAELLQGNALIESATFLAILLGTVLGGILIAIEHLGALWVAIGMIVFAVAGLVSSLWINKCPAPDPELKIQWNVFKQTKRTIIYAMANRTVFLAILGISWFWFYGALLLTQIPEYTLNYLGGDEHMVTVIFAAFSIGIGVGSLLCNRLSMHKTEIGIVPFGSLGLTIFCLGLVWSTPEHTPYHLAPLTTLLHIPAYWYVTINAILMGIFGGFYSVPLYVLIQERSNKRYRSRIIAANNILNAVFVVAAALMSIILLKCGLSIPQLFAVLALLSAVVAIIIYRQVPEFFLRFLAWMLFGLLYRVKIENLDNIPKRGGAVLVCNHVSLFDPVVIMAVCPRRFRFVMDHRIFNIPVLSYIFRHARAIPISSSRESPKVKINAFAEIAHTLSKRKLIAFFPEGGITRDGEIQTFRRGIEEIIKTTPVPVVPMAIQGLWDSFFSYQKGHFFRRVFKQFRAPVHVIFGEPIPPEQVSAEYLYQAVKKLRGDVR
jgi:hypothetical protein